MVPVVVDWPGTVIAVNVGGALIPALMSLYLLVRHGPSRHLLRHRGVLLAGASDSRCWNCAARLCSGPGGGARGIVAFAQQAAPIAYQAAPIAYIGGGDRDDERMADSSSIAAVVVESIGSSSASSSIRRARVISERRWKA
jgi:hypothetical protein